MLKIFVWDDADIQLVTWCFLKFNKPENFV